MCQYIPHLVVWPHVADSYQSLESKVAVPAGHLEPTLKCTVGMLCSSLWFIVRFGHCQVACELEENEGMSPITQVWAISTTDKRVRKLCSGASCLCIQWHGTGISPLRCTCLSSPSIMVTTFHITVTPLNVCQKVQQVAQVHAMKFHDRSTHTIGAPYIPMRAYIGLQ
jgi:hypothetical protein